LRLILITIVAYLLGSIPFGYLIVRATKGADIRETGSGGTGATNVSRRAGKGAGVLTLVLDLVKGAAAVVIASRLAPSNSEWWITAAAVAVVLGHMFPVWLGFRGGKGVATGVGVFVMLAPLVVGIAAVLFVGVVALTRYISLGSMLAALSIPILLAVENLLVRPVPHFAEIEMAAMVVMLLIVFAHRENIARLRAGTESKFK
jgi:glycerol-3-phosphate acyltransferase PlsY